MKNQKIFFLFLLAGSTLLCKEELHKQSKYTENWERFKEFGRAVWEKMQKHPDDLINGAAFGLLAHAFSLPNYQEITVQNITNAETLHARNIPNIAATSLGEPSVGQNGPTYILEKVIKTCNPPTVLQTTPHFALTGGILTYHNYKHCQTQDPKKDTPRETLVLYTAKGANFVTGAVAAYITLSILNGLLKP